MGSGLSKIGPGKVIGRDDVVKHKFKYGLRDAFTCRKKNVQNVWVLDYEGCLISNNTYVIIRKKQQHKWNSFLSYMIKHIIKKGKHNYMGQQSKIAGKPLSWLLNITYLYLLKFFKNCLSVMLPIDPGIVLDAFSSINLAK